MTESDRQDSENWEAVASAIQDRLAQNRMTQMDVASRAQVSLTTVRELQHNLSPRRRRPQTLAAVSEALSWPSDYLEQVLRGRGPAPHPDEVTDPVLDALNGVEAELRDLRERVAKLEARLNDADARP